MICDVGEHSMSDPMVLCRGPSTYLKGLSPKPSSIRALGRDRFIGLVFGSIAGQ